MMETPAVRNLDQKPEASVKNAAEPPLSTSPDEEHEELGELAKHMPDAKLATAPGISAIALSMAMKYHDINTIQEGALYQQYKLEGKNIQGLHLDHVLDTATKLEAWLLGASERIATLVIDAIRHGDEEDSAQGIEAETGETRSGSIREADESPVAREGDAPIPSSPPATPDEER